MEKVTVIINNRDLLSWPKKMCEDISKMSHLQEIILIDNGSSNRKLLQWYKECPYKVVFLDNIGHTAPWDSGLINFIQTDFYVVTDPDLDLSQIPDDALLHLMNILKSHPELGKVGFSLLTDDIPENSPYFDHVNKYEKSLQGTLTTENTFINAPVDTTFALYDRRILNEYKICGARTLFPYIAKHIPWHITKADDEFKYYLEHANGSSSSYKWFTGFEPEGEFKKLFAQHANANKTSLWESYFPIYEKWLRPFKESKPSLLKIGIHEGDLLEVFKKYLKNASAIVGCDIDPKVDELFPDDPCIQIITGNASEGKTFQSVATKSPSGFDIIIDDGSHRSLETISNFILYFQLLKPGGIYILTNMQYAYHQEYDGGFFNSRSAANFFKLIFDLINIEHSRGDFSESQLFQTFFSKNPIPDFLKNGSIYSISAYNSIYVIVKSNQKQKPLIGKNITPDWLAQNNS